MSEEQAQRSVEIELLPSGYGRVLIDGHDISNRVSRIEINACAGKVSEVVLTIRAVEVKVMANAYVTYKMLTLDPDTAAEADNQDSEVAG